MSNRRFHPHGLLMSGAMPPDFIPPGFIPPELMSFNEPRPEDFYHVVEDFLSGLHREQEREPERQPGREPERQPGREPERQPGREPERQPRRQPERQPGREPRRESRRPPVDSAHGQFRHEIIFPGPVPPFPPVDHWCNLLEEAYIETTNSLGQVKFDLKELKNNFDSMNYRLKKVKQSAKIKSAQPNFYQMAFVLGLPFVALLAFTWFQRK